VPIEMPPARIAVDRHRQGNGDQKGDREGEELHDDGPREPLSQQIPEPPGDLTQQLEARQRGDREDEWPEVLAQEVSAKDLHS
jgi:hypothetical protein